MMIAAGVVAYDMRLVNTVWVLSQKYRRDFELRHKRDGKSF